MKKLLKVMSISLILMLNINMTVLANEPVAIVMPENIVDTSNHIYSYDEMVVDIALLKEKYPDKIEISSVGASVDGRAIHQVIIGNKNAKNAIYMQAAIHGREWMNSWILMESLEMCLDNWNNIAPHGVTYGEIFNNCCVYLLPMVNPDGVTISQFGLAGIRNESVRNNCLFMSGAKYPGLWKANANGVDLNRQFTVGWNSRMDVTAPASENYNGTAAFTEPEAQAMKYAMSQRNFVAGVAYHSMEGAIYWDVGQQGQLRERVQALALHCHNITGYRLAEASPVKGLEYNYMNIDKGIPTVCIETGTVACPLPYSQWKRLWRENQMMMVALAGCYQ
ncbi:MAG: hypothetical protein IJ485_01210 [Lachnospiraceae bacterium]|nr:hypothetical protein [Lachnospiraceae bacterium]